MKRIIIRHTTPEGEWFETWISQWRGKPFRKLIGLNQREMVRAIKKDLPKGSVLDCVAVVDGPFATPLQAEVSPVKLKGKIFDEC